MLTTLNYLLKKIELADSPPDITVLNANWDAIDAALKAGVDANNASQKYRLTGDLGLALSDVIMCNDIRGTGLYTINSTSTDSPFPGYGGKLRVERASTAWIIQYAIRLTGGLEFTRLSLDGGVIWTAWKGIATTDLAQMLKLTSNTGLGLIVPDDNLNNLITSGMYIVNSSTIGRPYDYGVCVVYARNAGNIVQECFDVVSGMSKRRASTNNGSTWTAWSTPGISEAGSNANGSYIKFDDGTMICFQTIVSPVGNHLEVDAYISDAMSWTYPSAFYSTPFFYASIRNMVATGTWPISISRLGTQAPATTVCGSIYVIYSGNSALVKTDVSVMTIGRWKA